MTAESLLHKAESCCHARLWSHKFAVKVDCNTDPSVTLACIRRLPAVAVAAIIEGQHAGTGLALLLVAVLTKAVVLYSIGIGTAAATQHTLM